VVPPEPRKKKPLVITDKHGNVIDLSSVAKKSPSPAPAASGTTDNRDCRLAV
jgi:hypothetical protein